MKSFSRKTFAINDQKKKKKKSIMMECLTGAADNSDI